MHITYRVKYTTGRPQAVAPQTIFLPRPEYWQSDHEWQGVSAATFRGGTGVRFFAAASMRYYPFTLREEDEVRKAALEFGNFSLLPETAE